MTVAAMRQGGSATSVRRDMRARIAAVSSGADILLLRLSSAALALALAAAFVQWLAAEQSVEVRRAMVLQGESWYALSMDEAPLGYLSTKAWRDLRGHWRFDSLMHFSLDRNPPVSISESLSFHPMPPYQLVSATHWSERPGAPPQGVVVEMGADGAAVRFHRQGALDRRKLAARADGPAPAEGGKRTPGLSLGGSEGHGGAVLAPEWSFTLGDHLALESWLAQKQPPSGTRRAVRRVDFEKGRIVNKVFKVLGKNAVGYRLAIAAPLGATEIQLDDGFAPVEFSMAGLFKLRRSTKREALGIRTPLHLTDHRIPLDQSLPNHTAIERLQLAAANEHNLHKVWPQARRSLGGWRLDLAANPISVDDDPKQALGETLNYPSAHSSVRRLARHALAGAADNGTEQLAALVAFVHDHIDYRPDAPPSSVLDTMSSRTGDCTEFADLLTTLARSLGWPARTVIGLAYSERDGPALAFHAWNEVALDGVWRAVDPTWNQLRVDATHIPLPGEQAALLRMLHGPNGLRFRVQAAHYFSER